MKKKKTPILKEIKPQEKIKKEQLTCNFKIKFKKQGNHQYLKQLI